MVEGESYEAYITHQAQKLTRYRSRIDKNDKVYEVLLAARLLQHDISWVGKSVLCLGARLGGEVRAFRCLGCFAVGIDVNPGSNSPYVLWGDFHALTFSEDCVDVVFTNSLDHSLDLDLVLSQTHRVLGPRGLFISEIVRGTEEGYRFDKWDVQRWERAEEVVKAIASKGFTKVKRQVFENPWPGVHVLWKKDR